MNKYISITDRIGVALANKVVRWRWFVILTTLVLLGLVAGGARNLTLSTEINGVNQWGQTRMALS